MKVIRDYIGQIIKKEIKGSQESKNAFRISELAKQETTYLVGIGALSPIENQSGLYLTDEIPVTLTFQTPTKNASPEDFDAVMEKARRILSQIINVKNRKAQPRFQRIVPGDIEQDELQGNPETIETVINLTFEVTQEENQ